MSKPIAYLLNEVSERHIPEILDKKCNSIKFRSVIQDFGESRNRTIYSKEVLTKALNESHILELKETGNWYGEAGHPYQKDDTSRQLAIIHNNISHKILETFILEDRVEAIIKTAHFEMGRAMRDELLEGTKVAFSMRGFGPHFLDESGRKIVKPGLKILTYDWILFPSFKSAYFKHIITEGNSSLNFHNESFEIPIYDKDLKFVMKDSKNFNIMQENFNFNEDTKIIVSQEGDNFIFKTERQTIKMELDDKFLYNKTYVDFLKSKSKK
jgi:hypothetical protein